MMNKLMQVVTVIGCWWELEKPDNNEIGVKWVKEAAVSVIGLALVIVGILMGWIKIPTYMGDGYDYDNDGYGYDNDNRSIRGIKGRL